MIDSLVGFDIHFRINDKHGKESFERRRAWKEMPAFVDDMKKGYAKEGGKVEVITLEQYRDGKWSKK